MSSAANEIRDIEQTLMKHIAMELRDEDPHQFVNAYTSGMVPIVCVSTEEEAKVYKIAYKYLRIIIISYLQKYPKHFTTLCITDYI